MPSNLGSSKTSLRKASRSGNLAKGLSSAGERDAAPDDASVHMSRRRESAAFREAGAHFLDFWRRFGQARDSLEEARIALVESKGVGKPAISCEVVAGDEGGQLAVVAARDGGVAGDGRDEIAIAQAGERDEGVAVDLSAGLLWVGEDNWAVLKQAVNRAGPLQGVPEVDAARLALKACDQLATEQNLEEIVKCLSLCSHVTSCPAVDHAKLVVSAQKELETEWSVYRMRELISVCGKLQGSAGLDRCNHILKVWPPVISYPATFGPCLGPLHYFALASNLVAFKLKPSTFDPEHSNPTCSTQVSHRLEILHFNLHGVTDLWIFDSQPGYRGDGERLGVPNPAAADTSRSTARHRKPVWKVQGLPGNRHCLPVSVYSVDANPFP
jgi:hypothetical protein